MKIPGQEHVMEGSGVIHIVRNKDGKVTELTMFDDPIPFFALALGMAGQSGPPHA